MNLRMTTLALALIATSPAFAASMKGHAPQLNAPKTNHQIRFPWIDPPARLSIEEEPSALAAAARERRFAVEIDRPAMLRFRAAGRNAVVHLVAPSGRAIVLGHVGRSGGRARGEALLEERGTYTIIVCPAAPARPDVRLGLELVPVAGLQVAEELPTVVKPVLGGLIGQSPKRHLKLGAKPVFNKR